MNQFYSVCILKLFKRIIRYIYISGVTNAAIGSNTYASSVHGPWGAANAVDGSNAQNAQLNTCLVTLNQQNPFIVIDLGVVQTITHIKVYNRLDCCCKYL
jgi:hypothetical protein